MGHGYAKLDKEIWDQKLSRNPRFISLWSFLIANCTFKEKQSKVFGLKVEYPSGVFDGTIRDISARTGVARSTVHRILKQMSDLKMVEFVSIEKWIINDINPLNGTVVRNRDTRRLIDLKNYKVIRLTGTKQQSVKGPEIDSSTGFAMQVESVISASGKNKVKLNAILDFHNQYKKSNEIEDDKFLRNLAYTLSKPRKSFFPYLQKALSYDYAIGHDFQVKVKSASEDEKLIPFVPKVEIPGKSSLKALKELAMDDRRKIETQAQENIINQYRTVNPNTPYFSALVYSEMLEIYNQTRVTVNS